MLILSLTTIPPSMFKLSGHLDRLLESQTVQPDTILLNVPESYSRFGWGSFSIIPKSLNEKVVINFCTDSGPATKLLGIFESDIQIKDDDTIIIIDDDISYPPGMCRDYLETFDIIKDPKNTALGVAGNTLEKGFTEFVERDLSHLKRVNVLQGWASYAMKGSAIKKIEEAYSIHHFPDCVFYQDDLFLSNVMKKHIDLRVIQTKSLWTQHSIKDRSKIDCPEIIEDNLYLRPYHADNQMHLNKSLGQPKSGKKNLLENHDGNLFKNLGSLDLYIRKGIVNFDITEERQKEILCHNFIANHGDFARFEDLDGLSLAESIKHLDLLNKRLRIANLCFETLGIKKKGHEAYTKDLMSFIGRFGISKAIGKFLEKLPYKPRENKRRKAAVIFHAPINGTHGCQTRALESIKSLIALGFDVHLLSKNKNRTSWSKTRDWNWTEKDSDKIKQLGVSVLDIFDPPDNEPFISPSWSDHIRRRIKEEGYDFILVHYEHILTPETYSLIADYASTIDTQDDVDLNGLLQQALNDLGSLEECRRLYSVKRLKKSTYNYGIPKIFISNQELENLGSGNDCFIPHVAKACISEKSFKGNPIFLGSDNVFNARGIKALNKLIDFPLDIVGGVANCKIPPPLNKNLNLIGISEDLSDVYKTAAFSVCPLVLGTGSKIKIQESLANATPVVSMIDSGLESDIVHGVNGFLCYTFDEFLEYCHLLNSDRKLCSKMGKAAAKMNEEKIYITFEEYFEILTRVGAVRNCAEKSRVQK